MPSYFMVRNDGTAGASTNDGRFATIPTGDFDVAHTTDWDSKGYAAADDYYYKSVQDAISILKANPPVAGDFILVSDAHDFTYPSGSITLNFGIQGGVTFVNVLCVSDANADAYAAAGGAVERTASANDDFIISGNVRIGAVQWIANDNLTVGGSVLSGNVWFDGSFAPPGASDYIVSVGGDGSSLRLINCNAHGVSTSHEFIAGNGSLLEMIGGSVTHATTYTTPLFPSMAFNGGARIRFESVVMTDVDDALFAGEVTVSNDGVDYRVDRCSIGPNCAFMDNILANLGQRCLITNTAGTAAIAEHQFFWREQAGTVEDATNIFRSESVAFPSGSKVSLKISTEAGVNIRNPLVFDVPSRYVDLTDAAEDSLTLYFCVVNTTTLSDFNVWAELYYPDATNKHIPTRVISNTWDALASSGTAHTDDSAGSTWQDTPGAPADLTGYNEYRLTLNTSGDAGAAGVPRIKFYVGVPSIDVYLDTSIGVS